MKLVVDVSDAQPSCLGVPGGQHDIQSLWGLYKMNKTLWFCLVSDRSSLSWGSVVLSAGRPRCRTIHLYVCLREPQRIDGICGTCSERGHLSCHCLLRHDRIYSDVPTLFSPPQINRSGRGGIGCDIPRSPPQYRGSNNGYSTNGGPQQQYGCGADGSAGYGATFPQQQGPRPFCSFGWEQRGACRNGPPVNDGLANSIA